MITPFYLIFITNYFTDPQYNGRHQQIPNCQFIIELLLAYKSLSLACRAISISAVDSFPLTDTTKITNSWVALHIIFIQHLKWNLEKMPQSMIYGNKIKDQFWGIADAGQSRGK